MGPTSKGREGKGEEGGQGWEVKFRRAAGKGREGGREKGRGGEGRENLWGQPPNVFS